MNITVAGTGYVGLVTGVCLAEMGHQVTGIDIQTEKIEMLQSGRSPIYEPELQPLLEKNLRNGRLQFTINPQNAYGNAEIIFIAVGTPEQQDGTANLVFVHDVAKTIAQYMKHNVIVCTKSTVPVGSNEQIKNIIQSNKLSTLQVDVVSNPEFLREGSAILDFFYGDRIVIGAESREAAATMEQLYLPVKHSYNKNGYKKCGND